MVERFSERGTTDPPSELVWRGKACSRVNNSSDPHGSFLRSRFPWRERGANRTTVSLSASREIIYAAQCSLLKIECIGNHLPSVTWNNGLGEGESWLLQRVQSGIEPAGYREEGGRRHRPVDRVFRGERKDADCPLAPEQYTSRRIVLPADLSTRSVRMFGKQAKIKL